jgi:hypothetical protein
MRICIYIYVYYLVTLSVRELCSVDGRMGNEPGKDGGMNAGREKLKYM